MPGRQTRPSTADPSAAACRVRGLATPFATSTADPPDASSAPERPWASPFKGFPSPRSAPLSGPLPSCRCQGTPAPPRRMEPTSLTGFRALFPRRVRADTGTTRIPAVDPFLGFDPPEHAPVRPGARFDRGASPLALRRLDVQARPGPRVLRCERVGGSVSGPPALVGFSTFRRSRRSVRRSSGRAHGFASHRHPSSGSRRSKPLGRDATAHPGRAARRRRPSVHDW
jgi:hypothetical protein